MIITLILIFTITLILAIFRSCKCRDEEHDRLLLERLREIARHNSAKTCECCSCKAFREIEQRLKEME